MLYVDETGHGVPPRGKKIRSSQLQAREFFAKTRPKRDQAKQKENGITHMLQIVIPIASWATSSRRSSNTTSTLLTASSRTAEIRTICSPLALALANRFRSLLLLKQLHLVMELCSQLFVLVGELPNPVLRNPVIPAIFRHVVSRDILDFVVLSFSQNGGHCFKSAVK
jgi:hypothetical protein